MFETFKKWKVIVDIKTNMKLKCLRYDNGEECIDGRFSPSLNYILLTNNGELESFNKALYAIE
jgi:hypothetical protein